jgi:hypothetical protein
MYIDIAIMQNDTVVPQKLKREQPYDSEILLPYAKELKSVCQGDICSPVYISTLFTMLRYEINLSIHQ